MVYLPSALAALAAVLVVRNSWSNNGVARAWSAADVPAQAQVISQAGFNVLGNVPPWTQQNGSSIFIPPGTNRSSLYAKPFHIYDDDFYAIIGPNPTLTLIAQTSGNPLFHEAVIWNPPTDEVFFVQNSGAPAAGTGLNKSGIIQKISLSQITSTLSSQRNVSGQVTITTVAQNASTVINPNGGTNYKGKLLFVGEGQGANIAPALYLVDPTPPYQTTVLLDNYFGRQFNALNDIAVNPRNKELYFTDPIYGYLQNYRPISGIRENVYRFNPTTGKVTSVADGFNLPNGFTFSPDGSYAYVADTGMNQAFFGYNYSFPQTIYRFDVKQDGTFENKKLFAFVDSGIPDGVHCDTNGNVYAGCGDGIQVWNPSGKLLGKIWIGTTSANFQFAGQGRMVICAETQLYYATLGATGAYITDYDYSNVY